MNTSTRPLGASSPELALGLLAARACEDLAANASSRSPKTRIGPSAIFGETRTEPLAFLTSTSHRASAVSLPEVASDLFCFIQEDPISSEKPVQGTIVPPSANETRDGHTYRYAKASPLLFRDPTGMQCSPACPDCAIGIWLGVGGQATGMAIPAGPGITGGGSVAVYHLRCLSGGMACTFITTCGLVGPGGILSATGGGFVSVRAHCVSDILGTSTGFNTDIGKRYGFSGEWEVSKNQPNAVSGSMTFGISFAGGAGVTGCKTTLISCSK